MEHEGTISIDLDMESANYIINLMSGRAILMQGDLGLTFQSHALLLSQERAIGVEKLNTLQTTLSGKITEKWPDTVKFIAHADDDKSIAALNAVLGEAGFSTIGDERAAERAARGKECATKGHCACDVGEACCFCGKVLEPGDKRAQGVIAGAKTPGSPGVQSDRSLLS